MEFTTIRPVGTARTRRTDWWPSLSLWAATRIAVALVSVLAVSTSASFVDRWTQWDVDHLIDIAHYGYGGNPALPPDGGLIGFFPGFPLLLHGLHWVIPSWQLAALLISLVAGAFMSIELTRLVDAEQPGAGLFATLAMLVSPFAVFLFAGYSEALFLALALPAWRLARAGRWPLACTLALLASSVRITGLFLAVALVIEFLCHSRRWRQLPWLALPLVSVAAYFGYLWWYTGDLMAWQHAQAAHWGRNLTNPVTSFHTTWTAAFGPSNIFTNAFRWELAAALVGVLLTLWLLVRRRWAEAAYVGLQMVSFLTSSYYLSIGRATLLWWPLWGLAGGLAVRRRGARSRLVYGLRLAGYVALVCLLAALLVSEIVNYAKGSWAG